MSKELKQVPWSADSQDGNGLQPETCLENILCSSPCALSWKTRLNSYYGLSHNKTELGTRLNSYYGLSHNKTELRTKATLTSGSSNICGRVWLMVFNQSERV